MGLIRWLPVFSLLLWMAAPPGRNDAQTALVAQSACQTPVLSRLTRHKVASGETIERIAQRYNLIPATLMGMNPVLRSGKAPVGADILIPPYNGIRVEVQPRQSWNDIAKRYGVRSDVLFEVNGCRPITREIFVPGVNWSPVESPGQKVSTQDVRILSGYPLPSKPTQSAILLGYGWGIQPNTGRVGFHGGIDLAATIGTSVLAAGDGTVAFAGNQGAYGKLIVINHAEGLQSRYAQLDSIKVKVGQGVKKGQTIGTVGTSGVPSSRQPHLHFEVRSRSNLGWVAQNPEPYVLQSLPRPNQAKK